VSREMVLAAPLRPATRWQRGTFCFSRSSRGRARGRRGVLRIEDRGQAAAGAAGPERGPAFHGRSPAAVAHPKHRSVRA
jgi:hypothetical protein